MDSEIVPVIPLELMKLQRKYGAFLNPQGYNLRKIRDDRYFYFFSKAIYEFTLDTQAPLTFRMPDGVRIQPDRHLAETDMGSIPKVAQLFIPKDRFLLGFLFHDSGYKHHGLYFCQPREDRFEFRACSQWEIDHLLWRMIGADKGNAAQRQSVYRAVRTFGGSAWRKHSGLGK